MGRELKRKQAKKEGRNIKEVQTKNKDLNTMKPKTLFIILGVLVLFCVILYFITSIFITKDIKLSNNKNNNDNEEVTNINNKILASDSLRQTEEIYYVYYYDTTNEDSSITSIVTNLEDKVYRVDLNDAFNSNFVGEPSGIVDNINNLKVKDPTVIKVESEKIVAFYNGSEEIKIGLN
ncbi:MAG: hypothetical protein ACI4U4_02605 [Bacilli bacterium]